MHDDDIAPPPYQAHSGFDNDNNTAGSSSAHVRSPVHPDGHNDDPDDQHVSPPSYEATYDSRSRSEPLSQSQTQAQSSQSATAAGSGSGSGRGVGSGVGTVFFASSSSSTTTTTTTTATYPSEKRSDWQPFQSSVGNGSALFEASPLDCGHWAARGCKLTSGPQKCCSCLDKRWVRADGRYPVYIDGLGDRFGSTTRWAHYCTPCQNAERAAQPYKGATGGPEVQQPNATELRKARREAARQAEIQRVSRAKAKNAVEHDREAQRRAEEANERRILAKAERKAAARLQAAQQAQSVHDQRQMEQQRYYVQKPDYYMTHSAKRERRERHAQRMAEQERVADERARIQLQIAKEKQAASTAANPTKRANQAAVAAKNAAQQAVSSDLVILRELRKQLAQQADDLEKKLAEKRAEIQKVDRQISMVEPRSWSNTNTNGASDSTAGMSASDRAAMAEKAALAEKYGDPKGSNTNGSDFDFSRASARVAAAAKTPLLADRTGSSSGAGPSNAHASSSASGSGSGSGFGSSSNWLGRVFGRGKGKEKERDPRAACDTYYGESFYEQKRAEAEAAAVVKDYFKEKD